MIENRLDKKLKTLSDNNKKAFTTFITSGDGGLELTYDAVITMAENGADIIELGVPFSDPIAEGITIQEASVRSLANGTKIDDVFELVVKLRKTLEIPLLLMLYANTIYAFGKDEFFSKCNEVGIDGVIVPDLPFEEQQEVINEAHSHDIHLISLIAPTSDKRIKQITKDAKGFIYLVSSLGVTGTRDSFDADFDSIMKSIRETTNTKTLIGFGIKDSKSAKMLKNYADGIIIGSAIVRLLHETKDDKLGALKAFMQTIRTALDED